jgi:hypothetical protein
MRSISRRRVSSSPYARNSTSSRCETTTTSTPALKYSAFVLLTVGHYYISVVIFAINIMLVIVAIINTFSYPSLRPRHQAFSV